MHRKYEDVKEKLHAYTTGDVVSRVSCKEKYKLEGTCTVSEEGKGLKIALLDLGAKRNIARSLASRGCDVTVYPSNTTAEEMLAGSPDGIMLSNGPGDPKDCALVIKEIKKLYDSNVPIFAI